MIAVDIDSNEELQQKRITRILTMEFPQYFALMTRCRQETSFVGPEGGVLSSSVIPQVQAVFPPGALMKNIRVGLQVSLHQQSPKSILKIDLLWFIHSFIPDTSIAPLQVHYYSEALPTAALILY